MEDCKCEKKCFVIVPEKVRNEIRHSYQQVLISKRERNLYLYGLIQITRRKSARPKSRSSFAYFVRVDGILTNICQKAFLSIHGISFAKIRTLIGKLEAGVICPYDKRELTRNRISENTKSRVKNHIESLLNVESVTNHVKDKKKLNVTKMWEDYRSELTSLKNLQNCPSMHASNGIDENVEPCDDEALTIVSKNTYASIFNDFFPEYLRKLQKSNSDIEMRVTSGE